MNNDITRYGVGPRMSEAVAYNGILWVAGQLGEPTGTVASQMEQALGRR
jgi:enamine deaminase RidA (YjgF/YER057c/UK114 family)